MPTSAIQRALGLGPLALYACFHLWTHWPALAGREAWLARAAHYAPGPGLAAGVLALFAIHAALGLVRARREPASGARSFQLATGLSIAAFIAFHLTQVWPASQGSAVTPERSYERLWEQLGQPLVLGVYVLGCAALAAHLAHGLYLQLAPHVPQRREAPLRYAAGLSGFVLFVLYLQLIGRFAAGEPMLPSARPVTDPAAYVAVAHPQLATARSKP